MHVRPGQIAPRLDGWILALLALGLYLSLGQSTPYKVDGQILLFLHARQTPNITYHLFYPGLLDAAAFLLKPFGLGLFRIGCVLSAVGTAAGVLGVHMVCRSFRFDRREAVLATAFVAVCPAWMFFATVVEVHGPFLPFAVMGFLAISSLVRHGGSLRAVLAGLVISVAYQAHPTGVLLIFTIPFFAALADRQGVPGGYRLARHGLLVAIGFAVGVAVAILAFSTQEYRAESGLALSAALANPWTLLDLGGWASNLWGELLLPYSPLVILGGIAWLPQMMRPTATWLLAATVPFVFVSQLVFEYGGENGAYLAPLACPAALCILPLVRARLPLALALLACSAALGTTRILLHENPEPPRAYADGFRSVAGEKPIVVLGQYQDLTAYFLYLSDLPLYFLGDIIYSEDEAKADQVIAATHKIIEDYFRGGHRIILPQGTLDALEEACVSGRWSMRSGEPGGAPDVFLQGHATGPRRFREFLHATYKLEPVAASGFAGVELRRRR